MTVSYQRNSSDSFENRTLCFDHVRSRDNFFVRGMKRNCQPLVLNLIDSQELPRKVGTENCSTR